MQMTTEEDGAVPRSLVSGQVARLRLLTGLLQGVLLYALYYCTKNTIWPVTNPYFSAPLALFLLFVPILFPLPSVTLIAAVYGNGYWQRP